MRAPLDLQCITADAAVLETRCDDEDFHSEAPETEQLHSASFKLPPVKDMDTFRQRAMEQLQPRHGTTTLAFKFQGGVIVAVDSRATMGPTISSQTVKKVIEINPYLLGTMAGGAADCSFWERNLGVQCRMHELEKKRRISVQGAAKLLANALYGYKGLGLSCGTMIAGWDEQGPHIYFVDDSGSCVPGNRFSVGSGAIYAYGVLDTKYSWDLSADDAAKLGRDAIYHATFRDAMSGGTVSVYHITEQGWTKVMGEDVSDLFGRSLEQPSR